MSLFSRKEVKKTSNESKKTDFSIPKYDLFSTEEQRYDSLLSKIRDIPLSEIDDFPEHPFKVKDDEDMLQLVESIKERGIITPATVKKKDDGRYELISGHRRKRASELAGLDTLRCEVVDLTRDEAIILMVESNFQRSEILPSEKAFAYKMRLEAMKRQAGRPSKNNSATPLQNFDGKTSRELLAEASGESHEQIRKYIRLTNLVPELLELVDEGYMKMRPAVEISYINEDYQKCLVKNIFDEEHEIIATPSHDQAIRMRKLYESDKLNADKICEIMSEEKPNQREKLVIKSERILKHFSKNMTPKQREDYICKALEFYNQYRDKQKNRDSR